MLRTAAYFSQVQKDTYNLLSDGMGLLVRALAEIEGVDPRSWAQQHGLGRYFGSSLKGQAEVDWGNQKARKAFLQDIVSDADRLLQTARQAQAGQPEESERRRQIVPWLYWALLESSSAQGTLGKMALGIIVSDGAGKRISFLRATGRHFAKIISGMILLIGFIMIAFTKKKQGLHDIIADCLVVVKSK